MRSQKSLYVLVLIYFLAFGLMLLNVDGQYWDDWALGQPKDVLLSIYEQSASVGLGYITWLFRSIGNGLWIFRILAFFEFLFSGLLIYNVLQRSRFFSEEQSFIVALLFLTYPIFATRAIFANYLYPTSLFLFWLAFSLISKNKISVQTRILALCLFAMSFVIQSFFLMYVLVAIYLFLQPEFLSFKERVQSFFKKYADFIFLPFVVKASMGLFMVPHGLYYGYNQITADKIFSAFQDSWKPVYEALFAPFVVLSERDFYLGIVLSLLVYALLYSRRNSFLANSTVKQSINFLLLGVLASFLAVFPYLAVGKMPMNLGYESRHQLNMGLGLGAFGLFLLAVIPRFTIKKILNLRLAVFSFFVGFCVLASMRFQLGFLERNLIKDAVLLSFQSREADFKKSLFVTTDNTENSRFGMFWEFYEVSGMWKKATGKTNKLFIYPEQTTGANLQIISNLKLHPQYNFTDWDENKDADVLEVNQIVRLGFREIISAYLLKFRSMSSYQENLLKIYSVSIHK